MRPQMMEKCIHVMINGRNMYIDAARKSGHGVMYCLKTRAARVGRPAQCNVAIYNIYSILGI